MERGGNSLPAGKSRGLEALCLCCACCLRRGVPRVKKDNVCDSALYFSFWKIPNLLVLLKMFQVQSSPPTVMF